MQGQDAEAQNAVSILQEYIQSCSDFPPHSRILMWNFEKRLQEDSLLQFRATVSFVFKQVPHFFRGSWQTSKKKAQRDTAERVRRYMMQQGEKLEEMDQGSRPQRATLDLEDAVRKELLRLRDHFSVRCQTEHVKIEVEERLAHNTKEFRAVLLLEMNSVPHHFAGAWCASAAAATSDACDRVFWYFGEGEPTDFRGALNIAGRAAEQPPPQQLVHSKVEDLDDHSPGGASVAERPPVEEKTILMQVQNTLQKTFSKDTAAGEKVWVWTYTASQEDPQVFRATAEVPSLGRTFAGDWCRGKKLAQRNACLAVKAYLDSLPQSET